MITEGKVFAERYRIEQFIGKGGMALVFRASDMRTGHNVAIKVLKNEFNSDAEFLERFQREAQAASLMNHHNIVNLLDVGIEGEDRYLVFEYISGTTLRGILDDKKQLPVNTAVQIAIRILSALQHAHQNNIIHRDIKPQNILINEDGLVKVADFGIARIVNTGTVSKDGMVIGSVHYSSPEQASGLEVTPPSDLYSTGVVLYEMITGRVPFVGDNPVAVAMQHLQNPPPPIEEFAPNTPPAVAAVIMKALEKRPENRFASAREMAEALNDALNGKLRASAIKPTNAPLPSRPKEVTDKKPTVSIPRLTEEEQQLRSRLFRKWILIGSAGLVVIAAVLTIVLLTGISGVTVPDLLDKPAEEARRLVEASGLVWQEETASHDTVAAGNVINQSPGPDERANKGATVTAIVSTGAEDGLQMPSLVGLGYDEAVGKLKEKDISNIVVVKTVSIQPVDTIANQSPSAGSPLAVGDTVELTVSGGSTMVPSFIGMTPETAEELLRKANLTSSTLSYSEVPTDRVGLVVDQNPTENTNVMLGTPVYFTIGIASQPYQAELSLYIAANPETSRILKVVLVQADEEIIKYRYTLNAGEELQNVIPLKSDTEGEQLCRVYLDDEIYQEITLKFSKS